MKPKDDIRRVLRAVDPAESRELPAADRARMRAVVTNATLRGQDRRSYAPVWAVGAALTVAAVVLVALIPRDEPRTVVTEAPPTRIVFTAPQGTKILWFVGTPTPRS